MVEILADCIREQGISVRKQPEMLSRIPGVLRETPTRATTTNEDIHCYGMGFGAPILQGVENGGSKVTDNELKRTDIEV